MSLSLLRNRMFLLAVAGLLPLAVMAGVSLLALDRYQHEQAVRSAIETNRALATAVDSELAASISTLEALAGLVPPEPSGLRWFHGLLQDVVATQPRWIAVKLADASATVLLHSGSPFGAPLAAPSDAYSLTETIRTGRPVVGRLVKGADDRFYVPIRVPVLRRGDARYVLTAELKPDSIASLLARQQVPADWVVSIFDSQGLRVARSRQHERYLGTPAAPSLAKLMADGGDEGFGITHALEGDRVYTVYSRSRQTGWSVATGMAPSVFEAGALRSRLTFVGGLGFSVVAALLAALALGAAERRHEVEREQLLKREQSARAIAEEANRAKDDFLAMLGHELRNPLGAISNARSILESPRAAETMRAHATAVIGRQVDHLSRMTDDLLDVTRAMTGKIVLQRKPLDFAEAVREALVALRESGKPVAPAIVEKLEPVWIEADPTRIEQIVTNLVGNALKYTLAGGRIEISLRRERDDAVLRVADDGIGMTDELAARVFEPFVQGERGLDRSHGGLGLGLTLVRQLALLHGGSASAQSDGPNRGSEFVVRLPAIEAPRALSKNGDAAATASGRDILIVDDNDDARDSLKLLFELEGHRVRAARDAPSALELLRSAPSDVAIIDIGLPVVDGYELARQIAIELADGRRPRLVALTGYGMPSDIARSRAAGFDLHLVKPVDSARLRDVLA